MSGMADIWKQTADKFSQVLDQVRDDQWDAPTNCGEWTVRDLVDHAVGWQGNGGGMVGAGTTGETAWPTTKEALGEALADPSNLEGTAEEMGGMPKQQVAGFLIGDLAIHSWDLARAIGVDDTLPPAAVEATLMGLQRVPTETLRSSTMFGEPVEISDDASAQDKLIAFSGRQP